MVSDNFCFSGHGGSLVLPEMSSRAFSVKGYAAISAPIHLGARFDRLATAHTFGREDRIDSADGSRRAFDCYLFHGTQCSTLHAPDDAITRRILRTNDSGALAPRVTAIDRNGRPLADLSYRRVKG